MSKSLTKGMYYLTAAIDFFTVAEKEMPNKNTEYTCKHWVKKLKWIQKDVVDNFSKEGKDVFKREIEQNDYLTYINIFEILLRLSPEQRELIERTAIAVENGDAIEYVEPNY